LNSALAVTQSGSSWNASASRRVVGDWRMLVNTSDSHTRVDQLGGSDSSARSYSAAFSGRKIDLSASYSKSNGLSVMTGTGLAILNPADVSPEIPTIVFNGSSYAFTTTYHPKRRLTFSGDYSHALYSTVSPTSNNSGELTRYDARVEYLFRNIHFNAGYSHLSQGFGALVSHQSSTDAFAIGISRSFDIF